MTLVGTPLDLPLIKTATKASPDSASSERSRSRADSPLVFSSLVRKVATRSAVEAALAVAEKDAEPAVDKDETAALVEELRTQLEAARAEVSDVHARLIAAEEKAGCRHYGCRGGGGAGKGFDEIPISIAHWRD